MAYINVGPTPGAPFATVLCPDGGELASADDIQRVAGIALANDADLGTTKVAKAGDTMTGALVISPSGGNQTAVTATGTGSGRGGAFQGGPTGPGAIAQAGGGNAPGFQAQGDGTGAAIECLSGGVQFLGAQPAASADPGTNTAHALSTAKALALITTDGAGGVTLLDGLNITSVSISSTVLTINMVNGFAGTVYMVQPSSGNTPVSGELVVYEWNRSTSSGTQVNLYGRRQAGGTTTNIDFSNTVNTVCVSIFGRQ